MLDTLQNIQQLAEVEVMPIFEQGDRNCYKNYRDISLLNIGGKKKKDITSN
jgi:hypothetical protein